VDWDYLIIGSGFGGSVCGLRLVEKGYRVAMLEQGRRLGAGDFPRTNWNLKRWLWLPPLGWRGLFRMTFFPHVTVLSGVGVGGGSLVYANTLPVPPDDFFTAPSWAGLADWKRELEPHYGTALRMLGAVENPTVTYPDEVLREVARDLGRAEAHRPTTVAVYFGEAGATVPDPYFGGEGPSRTGCNLCGGCMLGCRHDAKNTLDKNYLYLAEKKGLVIEANTEAIWVRPLDGGYEVTGLQGTSVLRWRRRRRGFTARNVIFAGGVLGTVSLLLRLRGSPDGLARLSDRLGQFVRTNSEALIGVVSMRRDRDLSKGIAIGSILQTDSHSHLEPVRYPEGAGFFRLLTVPHVSGGNLARRVARLFGVLLRHPWQGLRAWLVPDWAKHTVILLYMRALEGHLSMKLGRSVTTGFRRGLTTALEEGPAPTAFMPEATDLAHRIARKVEGFPQSLITETLMGIPTTAHILGGCCMGEGPETGVIDHRHRVWGYEGLYVVDGSAVSANPGVNPALTICALGERAMSFICQRSFNNPHCGH
jgi:cholesterol oxidase